MDDQRFFSKSKFSQCFSQKIYVDIFHNVSHKNFCPNFSLVPRPRIKAFVHRPRSCFHRLCPPGSMYKSNLNIKFCENLFNFIFVVLIPNQLCLVRHGSSTTCKLTPKQVTHQKMCGNCNVKNCCSGIKF